MAVAYSRDALLASGGNVVDVRSALLSATGGNSGNSGLSPELFASIVQVQTTGVDLDFLVSCVVVRILSAGLCCWCLPQKPQRVHKCAISCPFVCVIVIGCDLVSSLLFPLSGHNLLLSRASFQVQL